jgi:hypothetical protein
LVLLEASGDGGMTFPFRVGDADIVRDGREGGQRSGGDGRGGPIGRGSTLLEPAPAQRRSRAVPGRSGARGGLRATRSLTPKRAELPRGRRAWFGHCSLFTLIAMVSSGPLPFVP